MLAERLYAALLLLAADSGAKRALDRLCRREYAGGPATLHPVLFDLHNRLVSSNEETTATNLVLAVRTAEESFARAAESPAGRWRIDTRPEGEHIQAALDRAQVQASHLPGTVGVTRLTQATRTRSHENMAAAALALLNRVWPAMADEVTEHVRELIFYDGRGVIGFTDFNAHGAIFLQSSRIGSDEEPRSRRIALLADAIVHEATHVRMNAAMAITPVLSPGGGSSSTVESPLRKDPRPIYGVFQQMVVLTRLSYLYELLEQDAEIGPCVRGRELEMHDKAMQAHRAVIEHAALTREGKALVGDVDALLKGRESRKRGSVQV